MAAEERIQAWDQIISKYTQVSASLRLYQRVLEELLSSDFTARLITLVETLRDEAEHSLALLLREQARQPAPPPLPVPAVGSGSRRMVRTRDKGVQLGRARARTRRNRRKSSM